MFRNSQQCLSLVVRFVSNLANSESMVHTLRQTAPQQLQFYISMEHKIENFNFTHRTMDYEHKCWKINSRNELPILSMSSAIGPLPESFLCQMLHRLRVSFVLALNMTSAASLVLGPGLRRLRLFAVGRQRGVAFPCPGNRMRIFSPGLNM